MAEMGFWNNEGSAKWIIDVPRKGEQKVDTADLYIFPDLREAKIKTPAGKLYIADNVLFNINSIELRAQLQECLLGICDGREGGIPLIPRLYKCSDFC
jgi:hypothetical protein